jgi:cbb3-type cytochrome c oxidase subunit II
MQSRRIDEGWRGAVLIAVTYVYFLIFAQFAFLARLAQLRVSDAELLPVMIAMALAGICFSFVTQHLVDRFSASALLRTGFAICAVAALLSLSAFVMPAAILIALLIGAGLGIVTVSLVAHLPQWCGIRNPLLVVGMGTGLGYALCNVPALFTASPRIQALVAAVLCLAGFAAAASTRAHAVTPPAHTARTPFYFILLAFVALIWLDSAAFYIIQHSVPLKTASWSGSLHLWIIGTVHLSAAIAAAMLLRAGRVVTVLSMAVAALGAACILLASPTGAPAATLLYPVGVSLYSVTLVAYPSMLSRAATARERAQRAAWIYAVAGWIGSAMGIGMGQHLGSVPRAFVVAAVLVVSVPALLAILRTHLREVALLAATLLLALALEHLIPEPSLQAASTAVERGRQVYISEGCISCHSQYVRPDTTDEIMWGPTTPLVQIHMQRPPLIGNRRQGPDLAQVGTRRSPLWLRAHLVDPAELSYRSPMPSYAFLFGDERGPDLVAYLTSLHTSSSDYSERQSQWQPDAAAWAAASSAQGAVLYQQHCATCHEGGGAARLRWFSGSARLPADLRESTVAAQLPSRDRLARIIRFGTAGTSMPGHEYLNDLQIASLAQWLEQRPPQSTSHEPQLTGDFQ